MNTIVIVNQKGGVGKTTIAAHLAHGLALQKHKTLAIDLDPQGCLARMLGEEPAPSASDWLTNGSISDTNIVIRSNLALIPADKSLQSTVDLIAGQHGGRLPANLVTAQVGRLNGHIDYVILDTAPSATQLQAAAIATANLILVPAKCAPASRAAIVETIATIRTLYRNVPGPTVLIVPTLYDQRRTLDREILDELREHLGGGVLPPIHVAAAIIKASEAGQTVFETAPSSRAADELRNLVWRVRNHFNGREP